MFRNYLLTALRQLWRQRGYSLINIVGLAVGLACCILILLYVRDERSYDNFHPRGDRTFRVALDRTYPEHIRHYATIPHSYAEAMKADIPEVEEAVRLFYFAGNNVQFQYEGQRFEIDHFMWADSAFFRVFGIPLLKGDPDKALTTPNSVVLTGAAARRMFGEADPLGKTLKVTGAPNDLVVTGVCGDVPPNSHLRFEVLSSTTNLPFLQQPNFVGFSAYTYLVLRAGAAPAAVEAKFPALVEKHAAGQIQRQFNVSYEEYVRAGNGYHYFLQPLLRIHLTSNLEGEMQPPGSQARVSIFSAIALFILLIAIINFMNLATAKSTERAREVGIRKTLGGMRGQLVAQFLTEAVLMTLISSLAALLLLRPLIPLFNNLTGKAMQWESLLSPGFLAFLLGTTLVVGLLAGSYPAAVLSGFRPVAVLKGKLSGTRHGAAVRNGLVIFQFAISVVLIISTMVVFQQMAYIRDKALGFNKEQVVSIRGGFALDQQTEAFKQELTKLTGVANVGTCSTAPGEQYFGVGVRAEGRNETTFGSGLLVDEGYIDCMQFDLLDGRGFSRRFNDTFSIILNETAARELQFDRPVGKRIFTTDDALVDQNGEGAFFEIIGLVKDFHFQSLHQPITPLFLVLNRNQGGANNLLSVRLRAGAIPRTISRMEELWTTFAPDQPFEFTFLDRDLDNLYQAEQVAQQVFSLFALIAIFIACMGLLGLATFLTRQRTKEIGVRKVLGAGVGQIVGLLSRDFLRLVFLALLVAAPVAWYAMQRWLESFAYRTALHWWIFPLAGALAILIAFLTVSYQSIRAALGNPVKALRNE